MRPDPRSIIDGRMSWVRSTWRSTLAWNAVSRASRSSTPTGSSKPGPLQMALFTNRSTRPHSSRAVSAAALTDSVDRRSIVMGRARWPRSAISAAVVSRLPGTVTSSPRSDVGAPILPSPSRTVRAVMATSYPASARASALARPIPLLAPVTSAMGLGACSLMTAVQTIQRRAVFGRFRP